MKRFAYGILSGLLVLAATAPVRAEILASTTAQSNSTIGQMFREQRVLTDEMRTAMMEMKTMMAEMKALTSLPEGQTPTTTDLYKQQQILRSQMEMLLAQTRIDTILSRRNGATVQGLYQQQVAMLAELKGMMADMKMMIEVQRGRAGKFKQ